MLPPDEDAEIEPVPTTGGGHVPESELDHLERCSPDLHLGSCANKPLHR